MDLEAVKAWIFTPVRAIFDGFQWPKGLGSSRFGGLLDVLFMFSVGV